MTKFINLVKSFTADEDGAFASEYAIFLILIAAVLVLAVTTLREAIQGALEYVAGVINDGVSTASAT